MTRAKLDRTAFRRAMGLCTGRRDCPCENCAALRELTPQEPRVTPTHTNVEYAPAPDNSPYPVPSNAAHIWIANGALHIGLPPTSTQSRGTSVVIPLDKCGIVPNESGMAPRADQMGWQALLNTLHARARREPTSSTVGTPGAPAQYDIERVLKAMGRTTIPKAAPGGKIELTDEDLGL